MPGTQKSLVIVGGGVIGLCTAWFALQRGWHVTVLERSAHGPDGGPSSGCSLGNAGMIVPSHFVPLAAPGMVAMGIKMMRDPRSPFYIRPRLNWDLVEWGWRFARTARPDHVSRSAPLLRDLSLESRRLYEEWDKSGTLDLPGENPGFGLTQRGLLMLCKTQHGLDEEIHTAETARALGIPADVLTSAQTAHLDPGVQMDIIGAVHYPLDCHLSPARFVAKLARALERDGAHLCEQTEVTGWKTENERIKAVRTAQGEFGADEFVIAGGAWSPGIAHDLGLKIPMQAGKGYSLTLPHPRQMPALCSILVEARVAVTPMGETLRFGGTMEIAGMDETIRPARVEGIVRAAERYFPDFQSQDFENVPVWAGLRPCSPDGLPYMGRFPRWQNLSVATGHAMMGLSLAPVTGKLMAEVIAGEPTSLPLDALAPGRFG